MAYVQILIYMRRKSKVYKKAGIVVIVAVILFHILNFLSLADTDIVKPQYVMAYLIVAGLFFFTIVIKNLEYLIFFGIFTIWCVLCLLFKDFEINVFYNITYFFSIFIIVQLYSQYKIGVTVHWFLLISYFVFIIYHLILGIDPNEILDHRSQNMVGFYMLCYVVMFYVEEYKIKDGQPDKIRVNVIPAVLNLIISLLMFGRSSIVISIMFLLVVIMNNVQNSSKVKNFFTVLLALFFTFFIVLQFNDEIGFFIDKSFSRFGKEGTDLTGREDIWESYIFHFENKSLYQFFGVPLGIDQEFINNDRNLHNSYLTLHSYTGIGILVVFYIIAKRFFVKGYFFLKAVLVLFLLRIFSDSVIFITYNDYVLYSLLFLLIPLRAKKIIK